MNNNKLLPIGMQDFEDLVLNGYLYVDKTELIHEMIKQPKGAYFLARPRRFGKSLLVSTLEAVFQAKKDLFDGLWLGNSQYRWEKYPVIRLDMSLLPSDDLESMFTGVNAQLEEVAEEYAIKLPLEKGIPQLRFSKLINLLSKISKTGKKLVILVDEYDHPLISQISNLEQATKIRNFLRNFYGVLKANDKHIRFAFLTGVSKFSKVSVFSGVSHLSDITTDEEFAALLGYTQNEIEMNFAETIQNISLKFKKNKQQVLKDIKDWYNGYRFSDAAINVYNPFSTLCFFSKKKYKNYWFETGTPTFLIDLMKQKDINPTQLDGLMSSEGVFSSYEIESLNAIPLLFQTGYLTIKKYISEDNIYLLGYPNREVEISFTNSLLSSYSHVETTIAEDNLYKIANSLKTGEVDIFINLMRVFFARIPYSIQIKNEKYYQTIFFLFLYLLGQKVSVEQTTNIGRIDTVIETENNIFIIEFKLTGSKEDAMAQILEKKHYERYTDTDKKIFLLGIEFKDRNIGEYLLEEVSI